MIQPEVSLHLQNPGFPWGILIIPLILALGVRLVAGFLDGDRAGGYIHSIGGRLLESSWEPFGPGWFGTHGARIYRIVYEDKEGRIHRAHLKTSMLGGVYLTEDVIVSDTAGDADYDPVANGRIRLEHGIPVEDYASPNDEVAAHSAQHPLDESPAYNELLTENEHLKARIRKLEGDAPDSDSGGTR